jgi:hypothetical protein
VKVKAGYKVAEDVLIVQTYFVLSTTSVLKLKGYGLHAPLAVWNNYVAGAAFV